MFIKLYGFPCNAENIIFGDIQNISLILQKFRYFAEHFDTWNAFPCPHIASTMDVCLHVCHIIEFQIMQKSKSVPIQLT